jgi:hypothetical protein
LAPKGALVIRIDHRAAPAVGRGMVQPLQHESHAMRFVIQHEEVPRKTAGIERTWRVWL